MSYKVFEVVRDGPQPTDIALEAYGCGADPGFYYVATSGEYVGPFESESDAAAAARQCGPPAPGNLSEP